MTTKSVEVEPLLRLLADGRTTDDLRAYFGVDRAPGEVPAYTGGRFERLADGGDAGEVADHFTADDLVAVTTLGVRVPARAALGLLEGPLGTALSELLRHVPRDVDLGDPEAEPALAARSAADRAWRLLEQQHDIGWVTSGKLLARKRPRLIPVYDQVVRCVLGSPERVWMELHRAFRASDRALPTQLERLHTDAGLDSSIGLLRVLDVALWMRHHDDHRRGSCGLV